MRTPLIIGMLGIAALVAAAIILPVWWFVLRDGDSVSPEVEVYFEDLQTLVNNLDDRSEAVEVPFPGQTFLRLGVILGDTAADVSALEPPAQAAAAHEELVAGLNDGTTAMSTLNDLHSDAATLTEVEELLLNDEALAAANARARAACADLRDVADSMGVEVRFELCLRAGETAPTREDTPTAESIDDLTEP